MEEEEDRSEEQFRELLANVVVRANRMLEKSGEVLPIGRLLLGDAGIDVFVASPEGEWSLAESLNIIQEALIDKIREVPALAGCLAYQDTEFEYLVVFMENHQNYNVECKVSLSGLPAPRFNLAAVSVGDGTTFLFGY